MFRLDMRLYLFPDIHICKYATLLNSMTGIKAEIASLLQTHYEQKWRVIAFQQAVDAKKEGHLDHNTFEL